jgi:SH3-like domain-containing protein
MKPRTSLRLTLRRMTLFALAMALAVTGVVTEGFSPQAVAVAQQVGPSGLPLPRYVSLRANRVNLRVGPGTNYAVEWMYTKSGIPMEIIQEYDNWRRVRDAEGAEGWINQSLLSGNRTAVAAPWHKGKDVQINLHREGNRGSPVRAILEPGVVTSVRACNGDWCEVDAGGHRGWVEQAQLWGVYPGETYSD